MKTSHYRPNLCAKGWITPTSTTPERAGTVVRRRDRPRGGGDARRAEGGCVYDCRAGRGGGRPRHRDADAQPARGCAGDTFRVPGFGGIRRFAPPDAGGPSRRPPPRGPSSRPPAGGWGCARRGGRCGHGIHGPGGGRCSVAPYPAKPIRGSFTVMPTRSRFACAPVARSRLTVPSGYLGSMA